MTERTRWDDYWDRKHPKAETRINGNGYAAAPGGASAYAAKAFTAELAALAAAREGTRNVQLNESGFNLGQLVAAGHLDRQQTWDALYDTALRIGLTPSESTATLRSAFRAGGLNPRYVAEVQLPTAPEVTVLGVNGHDPETEPERETPGVRDRYPALNWAELWADETKDEWIVEPLLPARRLVALYSAPKVGKSLLLLEMAVAIARGAPILGYTPDRTRRVLYVDFENDPRGDIRSRLQAMGRTPEELDNLVYLSFPRLPYLDTYMGGLELLEVVREYEVEVVVIDTISRAVGGEENENDTWLGFYKNTGLHLKAAGVAVIRLDHTGKDPTKGMRGGSAKYSDVDAVWSMTRVGEDTYLLECTANRLPITEKELVITREAHPLRHVASTDKRAAMFDARLNELVAELESIYGGQRVPSYRDAQRELKAAGHGVRWDQIKEAVEGYHLHLGSPRGEL